MTLGTSAVGYTTPTTRWNPNKVLSYAGGAYAFDGTTTAFFIFVYGSIIAKIVNFWPSSSPRKQ